MESQQSDKQQDGQKSSRAFRSTLAVVMIATKFVCLFQSLRLAEIVKSSILEASIVIRLATTLNLEKENAESKFERASGLISPVIKSCSRMYRVSGSGKGREKSASTCCITFNSQDLRAIDTTVVVP